MFSKIFSCCYPPNKDNVVVKKEFTCEENSNAENINNIKSANINNIADEDFATYIQNKKRENEEEQNGQFNGDKKFPVIGGQNNINFNKSNSFKHLAPDQKYKLFHNSNAPKRFFLDRLKMLNESKNDQTDFKRKVTTHNKEIQSLQPNLEEYLNTSVSNIQLKFLIY